MYEKITIVSHSVVSDSLQPLLDYSSTDSSVHRILQAGSWSGLPLPSAEDIPDPLNYMVSPIPGCPVHMWPKLHLLSIDLHQILYFSLVFYLNKSFVLKCIA